MTPINNALAILGEHYRNYVVIYQPEHDPNSYDIAYSDPYAAKGLLEGATKYHNTFLEGGDLLDEYEWVEEDDEDDSEEF